MYIQKTENSFGFALFYRFDANGDVLDRRYVYAEDLEGEGRLNGFRSYQVMKILLKMAMSLQVMGLLEVCL